MAPEPSKIAWRRSAMRNASTKLAGRRGDCRADLRRSGRRVRWRRRRGPAAEFGVRLVDPGACLLGIIPGVFGGGEYARKTLGAFADAAGEAAPSWLPGGGGDELVSDAPGSRVFSATRAMTRRTARFERPRETTPSRSPRVRTWSFSSSPRRLAMGYHDFGEELCGRRRSRRGIAGREHAPPVDADRDCSEAQQDGNKGGVQARGFAGCYANDCGG